MQSRYTRDKMQGQMRDRTTQCRTGKNNIIDNMSNVNEKNNKSKMEM